MMDETQTAIAVDPVTRYRELLAEELRPLITGLGIERGDLKAVGKWAEGRLHVTVSFYRCGMDLHVSSLAVGEPFAPRILHALQDMLDGMGLAPREEDMA